MANLVIKDRTVEKAVRRASQILIDYEYYLVRTYGVTGAYLANAKSFLKTYSPGGDVQSQLGVYAAVKSKTLRSILNRFSLYLEANSIQYLVNDLNEPKLPRTNLVVKLFLSQSQDRLRSKGSMATYATILNTYFLQLKDDLSRINKRTASRLVLAPALSDYSKRLYKTVLKAFVNWILEYQQLDRTELSKDQRMVQRMLRKISAQSLKEVANIKVALPRSLTVTYHKDSLSERQRQRLLRTIKHQRDRAIIALMAWNGLRTIEVLRLTYADVKFAEGKILVWSKGKSEKAKDKIKLATVAKREVSLYCKSQSNRHGRIFGDLSRTELDNLIVSYLRRLRVKGRLTPHSLRHTAGQLMYERKIPLELIQRTLRHADLRTTMVYAQKAIEINYFKRLRRF